MSYPEGDPLPAAPDLVRAAGSSDLFVLDGALRRPARPEVLAAWHLDPAAAREAAAGELDPIPVGAPLPQPFALRGSGPAVYALDVDDPSDPEAGAPGGLGGGCSTTGGGGWIAGLFLLVSFARARRNRTGTPARR